MSIYVDRERNRFGRMIMCHMFADTIPELMTFAKRLGLRDEWFQDDKTPHFDICLAKRREAIQKGAVEIDRRQAYRIILEWRAKRREGKDNG